MKTLIYLFLLFFPISIFAQWNCIGLKNTECNKIEYFQNNFYVANKKGLFVKESSLNDSIWINLGIEREILDFVIFSKESIIVTTSISNIGDDTTSIFITNDSGVHWEKFQNNFGGTSIYKTAKSIQFDSNFPDTLYARNEFCTAKSIDKGNSWLEVDGNWDEGGSAENYIFNIGNIIWTGGMSGYFFPYLQKSSDYGKTWDIIYGFNPVFGDNACLSLLISSNDSNILFLGMEDYILKSNDGGNTWSSVLEPSIGTQFFDLKFDPLNENIIYATGMQKNNLFVYVSNDFGVTWDYYTCNSIIYNVWSKNICFVDDMFYLSSNKLYLATNKGIYTYQISTDIISPKPIESILITHCENIVKVSNIQGKSTISIIDATGKLIIENTIFQNKYDIDFSQFPNGLYTICVENNGIQRCEKYVKYK